MAIGVYFNPESMSAGQYDDVIQRLDEAGTGAPAGRLYHACFGADDKLQVFDIWESQEAFDAFGQILMPILADVGLDPGQPMVEPVHHLIPGSEAATEDGATPE